MDKIRLDLHHCYGIKRLEHSFDFTVESAWTPRTRPSRHAKLLSYRRIISSSEPVSIESCSLTSPPAGGINGGECAVLSRQ